jgi:hypothetical protein
VASNQTIEFKGINTKEKYQWIEEVLKKFKYRWLKRNGKGIRRMGIPEKCETAFYHPGKPVECICGKL